MISLRHHLLPGIALGLLLASAGSRAATDPSFLLTGTS
jgi:hypothetical protein